MALTQERTEMLINYLVEDECRAQKLVEMDLDKAVEEINADGYDFTADELHEFAGQAHELSKYVGENGELDLDALGDVTGGSNLFMSIFSLIIRVRNSSTTISTDGSSISSTSRSIEMVIVCFRKIIW